MLSKFKQNIERLIMDYVFRIRHHMLKYLMYMKRMIYVLPQRRNNSDGSGKGSMTGEPRGRKGSQSPLVLLAAKAWSRVDLRCSRMNIEIGTGSPETNGRAIRENGRHTKLVNRNSTIWFDKDYHQR